MVPVTDRLNNFEHWMLKVHLKYLSITYRGWHHYSLTEPTLPRRAQQQNSSPFGLEEMRCTGEGQQQNITFYNQYITNLNDEQRNAFNIIAACLAYNYKGTKVFNIIAPGGCGKTFLSNAILAYARGMGKKCIATASSGIAATLLKGGRTAHSTFGIPIPILKTHQPVPEKRTVN